MTWRFASIDLAIQLGEHFRRFRAIRGVYLFCHVRRERKFTRRATENIARQSAVYATAAIGMTLVVAGGIDLSVGSVIAHGGRRGTDRS
jgi:ribose/xylose/arabinose/galactoside ABC-type transport system permease subunit